MMNKLYFDNNIGKANLNQLIILSKIIIDEGYEINTIENDSEGDIEISFSSNTVNGIISYENSEYIVLKLSDNEKCIKLFNKIKGNILL